MKKYLSILVATTITATSQVFASLPPEPFEVPVMGMRPPSLFMEYLSTLNTVSLIFVILSQVIVAWYLIRLLIRVYVLKTIQLGNLIRWLTVLFSCVYLLSILIIILNFIRNFDGY
jgi:hypothetical protein